MRAAAHSWQQKTVKAPTFCVACENLIWGFGKPALSCSVCKQVLHPKCQESITIKPCASTLRNPVDSIFNTLKRTNSLRKGSIPTQAESIDPNHPRMTLKEFNTKMKNNELPPHPISPTESDPLFEIFNWTPALLDRTEENDEEREKIFISIYEPETSQASCFYQSFYNQKQVLVTDHSIPAHIDEIYPKFKKKSKKAKNVKREDATEVEEEIEVPQRHSTKRRRHLLSSLTGRKDKERNEMKDTIKHNILTATSTKNNLDCIVIPCTVYGELAISNSPQTSTFLDSLFTKLFATVLAETVHDNFLGEMKANDCIIIETNNSLIHTVCCVALPNDKDYIDTYSLFWSMLSSIWIYNNNTPFEKRITSILCPSFHNPNKFPIESANRAYTAYRSFLTSANVSNPQGFQLLKDKETRLNLFFDPNSYKPFQRTLFLVIMLKGDLVSRNFISAKEFGFLIDIVKHTNESIKNFIGLFPSEVLNSIREAAARVIAHYTFPDQRYRFLRKEVFASGALAPLLEFVNHEKIQVHRELSLKDIQIHSQIARGGCGSIHKATYNGTSVAVKTFGSFVTDDARIEFYRELGVCSMLQHPNLIMCLCEGMEYLHKQGIIHRDLKSLNLMVTEDWGIQIIDFGTSRIADTQYEMTNNLGSTFWMAPEVFQGGNYDLSVDVYSFGIVMWEILTLQRPYSDIRGERPPIPSSGEHDDWIIKLMKKCWHQRATKRPTFEEINAVFTKNIVTASSSVSRRSRSIDHDSNEADSLLVMQTLRSRSKSPSGRNRKKSESSERLNSIPSISGKEGSEDNLFDSGVMRAPAPLRKKKVRRVRTGNSGSGYNSDSPVHAKRRSVSRSNSPSILITNS